VFHDMRQWWRGREVPMAGVSGGSPDADAALDAAFGATAYMLDAF
jgi:hypothetical protein